MKKITTLNYATIVLICVFSTLLHGAVPPGDYPPGKAWREQALEAWRIGKKHIKDPNTIRKIQEYLVPRPISITCANMVYGRSLDIKVTKLESGKEIAKLHLGSLHKKPTSLEQMAIKKLILFPNSIKFEVTSYATDGKPQTSGYFELSQIELQQIKNIWFASRWAQMHPTDNALEETHIYETLIFYGGCCIMPAN